MIGAKSPLVAQGLISFMMAFLMTGIFSFIDLGLTVAWINNWLSHFIMAWPIAFILSIFTSKIAFGITRKLVKN